MELAGGAVRTTCPYCGVGCGVIARKDDISGDPHHPSNHGRLCSKGAALGQTLSLEGRLLHPRIRGERVSWDRALDEVAEGLSRTAREHGPESIAFYLSGQLLTEDYYVANKLMKGFLGSANVDTNSRLCMASAVAGHRRAFGEDAVPGCYEDFELADLVVLVGSNTAWCHPVLFQRIADAKARRPQMQVVVVDPRRTATCDIADLHLPLRPGTDVWLFNGLLTWLQRNGCVDEDYVRAHTTGAAEALVAAEASAADESSLAQVCGIDAAQITEFFRLFGRTERVVTAFSQGVNQSSAGTDKVNAIINCHLLTGRIGRPGMGPFSLTGQPNAMGGREVGAMAGELAAHLDLGSDAHRQSVQRFWSSPGIAHRPGLKAVELFAAIDTGRVKAVWIMATNPAVSLPDVDRARAALRRCELVVVSDCVAETDTTRCAHVLLPALAWGEKDGTVTSSERRISRQRRFLPPPGEARPDWWIICEVARRMGFGRHFDYASPHRIFTEHARLSCAPNDGARCFDLAGLAALTREQYDALEPVQWPVSRREAAAVEAPGSTARLFGDGRFAHPDGRAHFIPTRPRAPANAISERHPLVLNSGRVRDQWHTMTRTGRSPALAEHTPEPFIDLHGQDALLAGVREGELARLATPWGSMIGRVRASGGIARGQVFAPLHWSAVLASDARVNALVSAAVDPVSGQPEFKYTPARVEPFVVDWYGVLVTRRPIGEPGVAWWTMIRGEDCVRYELAGRETPAEWPAWTRRLLRIAPDRLDGPDRPDRPNRADRPDRADCPDCPDRPDGPDFTGDYLDYSDEACGIYRAAQLLGDRLEACLYVSPRPQLPARGWLMSLFGQPIRGRDRTALLAGRPFAAGADPGPLVCSCHGIGRNTLAAAILAHGLRDAREVGARTRAGTNCGSCLPEIRAMLEGRAG